MEKLTLEYALQNKFKGLDLVRYFNPKMTNKDCDLILWEKTCFPICIETTIEQLNNLYLNK